MNLLYKRIYRNKNMCSTDKRDRFVVSTLYNDVSVKAAKAMAEFYQLFIANAQKMFQIKLCRS
jgi:hypothetical protein